MTVRSSLLSRQIKVVVASLLSSAVLVLPLIASAAPFGGMATQVKQCYNDAIIAYLSGPRGGVFVWTGSTETYRFGQPSHAGQWLLGLSGVPYLCVYSIVPLDTRAALSITMMGSSQ